MSNLRRIRKSISMTLDELSSLTGISKAYISELESGKYKNPSLGKARLLAYHLGVDVETIFPEDRRFIK